MTSYILRSWSILLQTVPGASRSLFLFILLTHPAQAISDVNSNGVSDLWEKNYNSGTLYTNFDPLADPDGDGWTNATEAISGTNPGNANTPTGILRPEIIQSPAVYITGPTGDPEILTPAAVSITWPTLAGKQYTLFASVDLTPGSWLAIDNETPRIGTTAPMGNAFPISQPDGSTPPALFYRLAISDADSDGDTLTNHEETQLLTDPFSIDTDLDGLPDHTDPAPLTSATLANPDGANPPLGSTTNLLGFWDFESRIGTTFPIVFPDKSGNGRHASATSGPQALGLPSLAGRIGPGTITVPSSTINGSPTYTVTGWFKLGKDSIKNASTTIFKSIYAIYDRGGAGPSPQFAPLGQGTGLFVRKIATGGEDWFVGGYKQTTHFNEFPNANGSAKTIFNGHYFQMPAGTSDDSKWHHFAVTRSATSFGQKVYLDGVLIIQQPLLDYSVAHDSGTPPAAEATTFTFGALYPEHGPSSLVEAFIDRVRVQSRLLTAAEILASYRQDIDNDGLWDITETNTALWRDTNSNGSANPSEYTYSSSPFTWQPTNNDTDTDGLTDITEQNLGTKISNPDSDGDLFPDGWEVAYSLPPASLNALSPNDPNSDTDLDGLTLLEEYRYNTNPNDPNTDGDTQNDSNEVAQGSDPNDPSDGGNPTPPEQKLSILLAVGDESGSESEDYVLNCYRLDPQTGQETRIYTLRSGGYGEYAEETQSIFRKGETYTFQIDWQSSKLTSKLATPGSPAEGPDYDYTFKVQPQDGNPGLLIDAYDPKTKTIGNAILAEEASNVATTEADFKQNFESKRVAIVNPKLEWVAVDGYDNIDDHVDPWSNPIGGKRIFPDFKDPSTSQIRHAVQLVVSGCLPGLPVHVKAFDVDDSTSETFDRLDGTTTPVIDPHGRAGDDNLPDHLNTAKNGHFWTGLAWGTNALNKPADANGRAKFIFRVGMQPGNNYRAVASINNDTMYSGVQTTTPTTASYLGPESNQTGDAPASPLLTVWRRLWVENDSMVRIPEDNYLYKMNHLSPFNSVPTITGVTQVTQTNTKLQIFDIDDLSSFQSLENGHIIVQSIKRPVTNTLIFTHTNPEYGSYYHDFFVNVSANLGSNLAGSEFRLYDDDDYGLLKDPLPNRTLATEKVDGNEVMIDAFKIAFIQITDASLYNHRNELEFYRNHPIGPLFDGIYDDNIDVPDSESLWAVNIVSAYQGELLDDNDPHTESESEGATPGIGASFSVVFLETVRESNDEFLRMSNTNKVALNNEVRKRIILTAAHEIGHHPRYRDGNGHHVEDGLMGPSGYANGETFWAPSILRFRKTLKWTSF
jgi:hypothetical protein